MAASVSVKEVPWKIMASTIATAIPAKNVGSVGFFRAMSATTTMGGISRTGLILNVVLRVSSRFRYSAPSIAELPWRMPRTIYSTREMTRQGTVVHSIYLMWSTMSTSATAEDRTVVSDRGDSLSPKMAPTVMAPAV